MIFDRHLDHREIPHRVAENLERTLREHGFDVRRPWRGYVLVTRGRARCHLRAARPLWRRGMVPVWHDRPRSIESKQLLFEVLTALQSEGGRFTLLERLSRCHACAHQIDDRSRRCPECGAGPVPPAERSWGTPGLSSGAVLPLALLPMLPAALLCYAPTMPEWLDLTCRCVVFLGILWCPAIALITAIDLVRGRADLATLGVLGASLASLGWILYAVGLL